MKVSATAITLEPVVPQAAAGQSAQPSVTELPQQSQKPEAAPQKEELDKIVKKMNETASVLGHSLRFEMVNHERMVIQVVDDKTGEVVRQFPPEALVRAYREMESTMGLLINERV